MPERSRAPSQGRRAWSMRVARPRSHPAARRGRGRRGARGAWPKGAGAFCRGSEAPGEGRVLGAGRGRGRVSVWAGTEGAWPERASGRGSAEDSLGTCDPQGAREVRPEAGPRGGGVLSGWGLWRRRGAEFSRRRGLKGAGPGRAGSLQASHAGSCSFWAGFPPAEAGRSCLPVHGD